MYTRHPTSLADIILNKYFNAAAKKLNVNKADIKIPATVVSFLKVHPVFLYNAILNRGVYYINVLQSQP